MLIGVTGLSDDYIHSNNITLFLVDAHLAQATVKGGRVVQDLLPQHCHLVLVLTRALTLPQLAVIVSVQAEMRVDLDETCGELVSRHEQLTSPGL
jgi:hypothetical protein